MKLLRIEEQRITLECEPGKEKEVASLFGRRVEVYDATGVKEVDGAGAGDPAMGTWGLKNPGPFTLRPEHIALLRAANITWWGGAGMDSQRPYGSSGSLLLDIGRIAGVEPDITNDWDEPDYSEPLAKRLYRLHRETHVALQIIVVAGPIPGTYVPGGEHGWVLQDGEG